MIRIEFCGAIASGKSTAATLLSRAWDLPLILEDFEGNPFWRNNMQNSATQALEKDLSFLLGRAHDIHRIAADAAVCDFAMFQTLAYSRLAGDDADTNAVRSVHDRVIERLGAARVVIRIRCPENLLLERIFGRGRGPEATMTADYLSRLDDAIDDELATLPIDCRVVEIDSSMPIDRFLETAQLDSALRRIGLHRGEKPRSFEPEIAPAMAKIPSRPRH